MRENNFQEVEVFEDAFMNEFCDTLTAKVKEITGEELFICGSLARMFSGELSEDYTPKDVDFVVSKGAFILLSRNPLVLQGVVMVEKRPDRIVFFLENKHCVELWIFLKEDEGKSKQYFKNKILYLIHL
mgnify:CR=1 FL=1|jgi:hypothetical protein